MTNTEQYELSLKQVADEIKRREQGTSKQKAIAFIMGDDDEWPLDILIYDDISIVI